MRHPERAMYRPVTGGPTGDDALPFAVDPARGIVAA
jgi:hypothetical protein